MSSIEIMYNKKLLLNCKIDLKKFSGEKEMENIKQKLRNMGLETYVLSCIWKNSIGKKTYIKDA